MKIIPLKTKKKPRLSGFVSVVRKGIEKNLVLKSEKTKKAISTMETAYKIGFISTNSQAL